MVVYSVLTTESDTQYVRVYSTYNPPDNDPTKNPDEISVKDAHVSITEEGGPTFTFQSRTIPRPPTSRYSGDILIYYSYPFRPGRGKTYALTVSSPLMGNATAKTTIPGQGKITPVNVDLLGDPFYTTQDFGVSAGISPEAQGFLVRIYVDYLYPPGNGTYQAKRFEIPLSREVVSCFWGLFAETYPVPQRRSTYPNAVNEIYANPTPDEKVPYNREAYLHKISYLYDREGLGILFKQAVFYLVQFDDPLWKYYAVANGYRDRFSVRTDEQDYTNIKNGAGVFGSTAVDSLVRQLPEVIPHLPPGCY
jgi:hypothetical protein